MNLLNNFVLLSILMNRCNCWFFNGGTVTSVKFETRFVTEAVPSSCVIVEESLEPCRNLRRIDIQPTKSSDIRIEKTKTVESLVRTPRFALSASQEEDDTNLKESGRMWFNSWTTETTTWLRTVMLTSEDVNTVVTFSVRGCSPTRLPFDLNLCSATEPASDELKRNFRNVVHYAHEN